MLRLSPDFNPVVLKDVMAGLMTLQKDLDGFDEFQHGLNRDFEQKSQDYGYGFVCRFADIDALQRYANHPVHKQLGARLVAMCQGGADGIWVADIEVI